MFYSNLSLVGFGSRRRRNRVQLSRLERHNRHRLELHFSQLCQFLLGLILSGGLLEHLGLHDAATTKMDLDIFVIRLYPLRSLAKKIEERKAAQPGRTFLFLIY